MPKRPCLDCGRLTSNLSRCNEHQAAWNAKVEKRRGSSSKRGYGSGWRSVAAQVVADHKASHGYYCPGYGIPAHAASDLTVDHIVPLSAGGGLERGNLRVLCRGCNSRKHSKRPG